MDQLKQQFLESLPTQTCTYIGTVTITCLQNTVSLTPLDTEQKLYVPPESY